MSDNLSIIDLYENTKSKKITKFNASLKSDYNITTNYEKAESDFEWLTIMEDTIYYLDNILRNPNRFIINEEEIVKVEQARRITVESIKHLSKHTNFIQKIEDNGDVKPSKILNINKDESFNTYENRVIYTLINNMKLFIELKEKELVESSFLKDTKKCMYNGSTQLGAERITMNMYISTKLDFNKKDGERDGFSVAQRIERLKLRISDLTNMPVYVALAKEHVAKVIPPIKKTNLILKNVNFQYAMKLWDFIQNNFTGGTQITKSKKNITDDIELRQMFDDTFLLNYLAMSTIDSAASEIDEEAKTEVVEDLTNKMIEKIVELNSSIPIEKITEKIGDKLAIIKNKREASLAELENKFNERLDNYVNRIMDFSFR